MTSFKITVKKEIAAVFTVEANDKEHARKVAEEMIAHGTAEPEELPYWWSPSDISSVE